MRLLRRQMGAALATVGLLLALAVLEPRPVSAGVGATVSIDETANGSTVTVTSGQIIELKLHSTYWRVDGSSAVEVVSQESAPLTRAAPPGECRPGIGCGIIQADFVARKAGTAQILASRLVCGEALACKPEERTFAVTIVVR